MEHQNTAKRIAQILLEKNCVIFRPSDPFIYASGLKGPIYCDNRKILSHPQERNIILDEFSKLIVDKDLKFDYIAGLATAGIPMATMIAMTLNWPLAYIRSKPKSHGKGNQVEGDVKENTTLLLVEDLVNQASSLEEAYNGLINEKLHADSCLSIVDYEMPAAKDRLNKMELDLYSLTNLTNLIEVAREMNKISDEEVELIKGWHADPKSWS